MLFFINDRNSLDSNLVKRCIKNVLVSESNEDLFNSCNQQREYPNSHLYEEDPKISKNKQTRSFEVVIRMLFTAGLINGNSKYFYK
jgi:hypothetical protein